MATGKVKTLYSDEAKTEALFPRTKTSAVSDENGRNLDAIIENLATTNYVTAEIAKAQLDGGDVDLSGYATKDDLNTRVPTNRKVNGKELGADIVLSAADVSAVPTSRTVNGKALSSNISLSASDVGARPSTWTPSASDVGAVPTSRKVNGKALTSDISLSASDVGARPSTWTPSASDVSAVPTSRTVNGKALSSNISLSASDVGARPSTWTPSASDVGAAPAGFGYGGAMTYINLESGTYSGMTLTAALDSVLSTMENNSAAQVQINDPNGYSSNKCIGRLWKFGSNATLEAINYSGYKALLRKVGGKWNAEWEYENPPLVVGKEYRTTERYNGKPVYVTAVNVGNLPAANSKVTVTYASGSATPIRASVVTSMKRAAPYVYYSSSTGSIREMHLFPEGAAISVYATYDYSGETGVAIVWYIKE